MIDAQCDGRGSSVSRLQSSTTQQKRLRSQYPMTALDNGGGSQSRRRVSSRGAVSMGSHSTIEVLLLRLAPPAAPVGPTTRIVNARSIVKLLSYISALVIPNKP